MSYSHNHILCGCFFYVHHQLRYLPQVDLSAHTTIIGTSSRTVLRQTFENKSKDKIDELRYAFPLYDGVSVVGFRCTFGGRVIEGVVQERSKAKATYEDAKARGETAGLLEQSISAADAFTTRIGNVPAGEKVFIDITYLGELEHDAEVDGLRFTIPTKIAPRYGTQAFGDNTTSNAKDGQITVTVDVEMPAGSAIKSVQSASHPIAVSVGHTSKAPDADPSFEKATAGLTLTSASLDTDFVLHVVASNLGEPTALLETHPTIPNQRALMTTLVPKFTLPSGKPEIIFICDRSGSMSSHIPSLISALNIFLKSLPVGVKFNICSFGSHYEFLWEKSKSYTQATLDEATSYVAGFNANFGGTQMYQPIEETFKRRFSDMNLEVFVLTDGEIWSQDALFAMMNDYVEKAKGAIRVFSLGVGSGASTSLVNGIARAGGGFAQFVHDNEKMDKKIVRMLRASLFPHITDYSLEIKYGKSQDSDDDFELVEKVNSSLVLEDKDEKGSESPKKMPTISLFQKDLKDDSPSKDTSDPVPALPPPRYLQTPGVIPPLFPFSRTTVYVLLSDACPNSIPEAVVLRGTCSAGPLELEIPITVLDEKATTIHQLAARKEMKELEEHRGWVSLVKVGSKTLKDRYPGRFEDMVEREGVRIGTTFQVSGKWCSFVAVEKGLNGDGKMVDAPPEYNDSVKVLMPMAALSRSAPSECESESDLGSVLSTGSDPRMYVRGGPTTSSDEEMDCSSSAPHERACYDQPPSALPSTGLPSPASSMPMFYGLLGQSSPWSAPPPGGLPQRQSMPVASAPPLEMAKRSAGPLFGGFGRSRRAAPAEAMQTMAPGTSVTPSGDSGGQFQAAQLLPAPPAPPALQAAQLPQASRSGGWQAPRAPDEQEAPSDPLLALAMLQLFEGNWRWTLALENVLGVKADAAKSAAPGYADDVLATACAVAYFKTRLAKDKDAWEMFVEKAEAWLHTQGGDVAALEKAVQALF